MKRPTRTLVALGLGFVTYRITVEFMETMPAVLLGLVVGGCVWALTGLARGRAKEPDPGSHEGSQT